MAKITSIIDIGSNSARMAVFEKTSRFGFHLIRETKIKVRIGQGAYENGGVLQSEPMQRALEGLRDFMLISKKLKSKKIICVATSALRDAPNSKEFTSRAKKELGIDIRIIDGKKEAFYGGVAGANLLYPLKNATTIDIGGGSTELAKIVDGRVVHTISLNIGTVRLKELFFDKKRDVEELKSYIQEAVSKISPLFHSPNIIAIGGTLRALSASVMQLKNHPLQTVHGFSYDIAQYKELIHQIASSSILKLKNFQIKKDRYDTIREGSAIFYSLIQNLNATSVITSGAGVREGVYLCDLLKSQNYTFPKNFNPSIKSLTDRFVKSPKDNSYVAKTALELFDVLKPMHNIDDDYKYELKVAAKLYNIGQALSFYQYHHHGYHFILNNLNFGFTHKQKMLIALLIKSNTKKLPKSHDLEEFDALLPDNEVVNWLSFILSLSKNLNLNLAQEKCEFEYKNSTLYIYSKNKMYLCKEATKKLIKPSSFAIIFKTAQGQKSF